MRTTDMVTDSPTSDQVPLAAAWSLAGATLALGASTLVTQAILERHFWLIYTIGHREGALEAVRAASEALGSDPDLMANLVWAMGSLTVALGIGALMLGRTQRRLRWPALAGLALALLALVRQFWFDEAVRWM